MEGDCLPRGLSFPEDSETALASASPADIAMVEDLQGQGLAQATGLPFFCTSATLETCIMIALVASQNLYINPLYWKIFPPIFSDGLIHANNS